MRWYFKYTISYRQLEEMMAERGEAPAAFIRLQGLYLRL